MKLSVKLETNNGWEARDIEIHDGNYVTALEVSTIHGLLLRIPFQVTDDGMYVKREPYSDPSYAVAEPFDAYQDDLLDRVIDLQQKHGHTDLGITVSTILEGLAYVLGRVGPEGTSGESATGSVGGDSDGDTDSP